MRKVHMLGAAFALATAMFWGTMLASPPRTEAALSTVPSEARCAEAGRISSLWVDAQTQRRAWIKADTSDDFHLIAAWVREAQRQSTSAATERSVDNFRAVDGMIAALEEHRRPAGEEE